MSRITDVNEPDRVHNFISGLKEDTKNECHYRNPLSLFEAINIAQTFDSSKFDHKRLPGYRRTDRDVQKDFSNTDQRNELSDTAVPMEFTSLGLCQNQKTVINTS